MVYVIIKIKGSEKMNIDYNKKWESLTISNDFLFSKLMRDKEICKEVLEVLLNIKIGDLKYLEEQKIIDIMLDAKSVRLDIYVESEDKVYNIEMQVVNNYNLSKRSRYYQSIIDINTIEKGSTYNNLKDTYIIFICTFDPFNKKLSKYTFENICAEDNSLKLCDGTKKIFFNSRAFEKEKNENIKAFLKYINGQKEDNEFINKINEKVEKIKQNKEWRREFMTFEMKLNETFEQGLKQGVEQGVKQGIEQGVKQGIEQGVKQGIEQGIVKQIKALQKFNISRDEIIENIVESYKVKKEEVEKYL